MIEIPGVIPIKIHPLFWLLSLLIGWLWTSTLIGAFLCMGIILISVLLHEFGHAVTGLCFGQKARIELAAFGGFTYRSGNKLKLWQEFLVVLNGPLAGLSLALFAYFLLALFTPSATLLFILRFTMVANLFWTVINLIPVMPLDGGHLASILLESIFGFKGVKIALVLGLVVAIVITIFFFLIRQFLVGALFFLLVFESIRSLRYYKIFSEKDRDQDLQLLMKEAGDEKSQGHFDQALEKYERVTTLGQKGILYTLAMQERAQIYKERGEVEKAYELLQSIQKDLPTEAMALLHSLAFVNGDLKTTVRLEREAYQANPSYQTALINACAHGKLGEVDAAIGWLECCIRDQIPSISEALARAEFDMIRDMPAFKAFKARVAP